MSDSNYNVINPVIAGTFKTTYKSNTAKGAAKAFWENLTSNGKYISSNVPKFLFSMMDQKTNELHHFVVTEVPNGKYTDYSIDEYDPKLSSQETAQLIDESTKARQNSDKIIDEQSGGKRRKRYEDPDDDSSSDDSDSDDIDDLFRNIRLKRANRPIVYWWYSPTIYKVANIFTPSFVAPMTPYVQLYIPRP